MTLTIRRSETAHGEIGGRQRAVVVLGMHRSGTSLVAHLVHAAGVSIGPPNLLIQRSRSNRDGYWEHLPLVKLNDRLLEAVDASWIVPPESPARVSQLSSIAEFKEAACGLVERMHDEGLPWAWKDPRMCLLLPFWRQFISPIYVFVVRSPLSIAASLKKRNDFPASVSFLLWQIYTTAAISSFQVADDVHFIDAEAVFEYPAEVCQHLDCFLDRHFGLDGTCEQRIAQMRTAIVPDLWHAKRSMDGWKRTGLDAAQESLYRSFRCTEDHRVEFDGLGESIVYPGWREYLIVWEAVNQMVPELRKRL